MFNVTHFHCPAREEAVPGDEKTHHLVPTAWRDMACIFCKRTERELRAELTAAEELKGLSVARTTIPEGLCGAEETETILNGMREVIEEHSITGKCVFLADHKGNHSWQ